MSNLPGAFRQAISRALQRSELISHVPSHLHDAAGHLDPALVMDISVHVATELDALGFSLSGNGWLDDDDDLVEKMG